MDGKETIVNNWLAPVWQIPIWDPDDSTYSLNGMHGKLSKKYLDIFQEDRLAGDGGHPAAGNRVFPLKESLEDHLPNTCHKRKGCHIVKAEGQSAQWGENTE